jgi:hypothetical protein
MQPGQLVAAFNFEARDRLSELLRRPFDAIPAHSDGTITAQPGS